MNKIIVYSNTNYQLVLIQDKNTIVLESADGRMLDTAAVGRGEWQWGKLCEAMVVRHQNKGGVR